MDCEIQAIEKLGFINDYAKLLDFNLKYSWYSSSENFGLTIMALDTVRSPTSIK